MNFFEAQAKARRSTALLVLLFILGVAGIIIVTCLFLLGVLAYLNGGEIVTSLESVLSRASYDEMLGCGFVVLIIVLCGSSYKIWQLSAGGHVVAEALRGELIPRDTANPYKQQLLNVVDEMSLASGIAAPPVYLIKSSSINAFAAGLTYDDAVIGVTQGLLESLNREEIQGVIAHEFSHIFNGDMRLNSRISGGVHGMVLIGLIGRNILDALHRSRMYPSRSSSKKGNPLAAAYMVGLGFVIIGFVGTIFGEVIKAYISRQREYFADASAVQYTRFPEGIANALKKIGFAGSVIDVNGAREYSHFYFADGVKGFFSQLFSTHPKLEERIYRIDPKWDGEYLKIRVRTIDILPEKKVKSKQEALSAVTTAAVLEAMDHIGQPDEKQLRQAKAIYETLPGPILMMAKHPMSAQAVVLALLADTWVATRDKQWECFSTDNVSLDRQTKLAMEYIHGLKSGLRLPLLNQCITSLKTMSESQYGAFRHCVQHFIDVDGQLSLFEWALMHLLLMPLDLQFGYREQTKEIHTHIGAVRSEIECFVSKLARTQYTDDDLAIKAFNATVRKSGATALRYRESEEDGFASFNDAVKVLQASKLGVRKKVLDMTVDVLSHDGIISAADLEVLHAMASTLRLPLPQVA